MRNQPIKARRYSAAIYLGWIALTAAFIAPASAQEDPSKYPTRPIHIVVGFAAGGGNDRSEERRVGKEC